MPHLGQDRGGGRAKCARSNRLLPRSAREDAKADAKVLAASTQDSNGRNSGLSPKLPRGISGDRLLRALKRLGFEVVHTKGSHLFVRPPKTGRSTTVPLHGGRHPIPIGTLSAILRQAGVLIDEIRKNL